MSWCASDTLAREARSADPGCFSSLPPLFPCATRELSRCERHKAAERLRRSKEGATGSRNQPCRVNGSVRSDEQGARRRGRRRGGEEPLSQQYLSGFRLTLTLFIPDLHSQSKRQVLLEQYYDYQKQIEDVKAELAQFADCDPAVYEQKKKDIAAMQESALRWTGERPLSAPVPFPSVLSGSFALSLCYLSLRLEGF